MKNLQTKAKLLLDRTKHQEKVGNARIAAMISYKNIEVYGRNRKVSHPIMTKLGDTDKIYLHAEADAILAAIKANIPLDKASLLIVRGKWVDGVYTYGCAKPCEICAGLIAYYRIKEVVWSEEDWE